MENSNMLTTRFDFTSFETAIYPVWEEQFRISARPGDFSWKQPDTKASLYGTTDMVFNRFILNQLTLSQAERDVWAGIINSFQDPKTGWYKKRYTIHYKEHGTAYALAALKLLDRTPKYPLKFLDPILESQSTMEKWIKHISWSVIWLGSHVISGIPACMILSDYPNDHPFFSWYFNWLEQEVDPTSGFWRRGLYHKLKFWAPPSKHDLGGAFHMFYIYEALQKSWLYPKKIIDHTLRLQHKNGLWDKATPYCIDLDGLYSLLRSSRDAENYRQPEIYQAVVNFLRTTEQIFSHKSSVLTHYPRSHLLPGALAAIAECQRFYPELVHTSIPWQQSLDQACFI